MHDDDENALTYVLGVAVLIFCLFLFLWPLSVQAKVVAIGKSRGDIVTLTDDPCTSKVRENIRPAYQNEFREATYYVSRTDTTVRGCWMLYHNDYQTIWEDGDIFALPLSFFRQVKV